MTLIAVRKRASRDPAGLGEYEFGCDWPGCEAREHWRGKRASEALHLLKKHGDWGSRATEGLYCEGHAPRVLELARRLGRHDVLPRAIEVGNLLAIALGNVEERYAFAGEESCGKSGVPVGPLGEADVGFGRWTSVAPGIAAFEPGDGRKLLFTAHDVTAEHDRTVEEKRDALGSPAVGGEGGGDEGYDFSGGERGKYAGRSEEARVGPLGAGAPAGVRVVPRDYWSGGHRTYRGEVHDPGTDESVDVDALLGGLFAGAGALDGDEVEILVRKTGERPFGGRIYARTEPHGYAPVEPGSPEGRVALEPGDHRSSGGCTCCDRARIRARGQAAADAEGEE